MCVAKSVSKLSFLVDQAEDLDDEIINLGDDEDDMEDEDQARQIARAIEIVEGEDQVLTSLSSQFKIG
jgi:hypothetical protein